MTRRHAAYGTAAGVVAFVTAATPLVAGGAPAGAQIAIGAVALVATALAVAGVADAFFVAAGLAFGAQYALRLPHRNGIDAVALVEAVLVFVTIETALTAREARSIARRDAAVRRAFTTRAVGLLLTALVAAFVVLALGGRRAPAPTAGLAMGLAAVVLLLAAADRLRRRATSSA